MRILLIGVGWGANKKKHLMKDIINVSAIFGMLMLKNLLAYYKAGHN